MPFNKWRTMVVALVGTLTVLLTAVSVLWLDDMLGFTPAFEKSSLLYVMSACTAVFAVLMQFLTKPLEKLLNKLFTRKSEI